MSAEKLTLGRAVGLALSDALEADPSVVLMGEDIGRLGGVFRVTDGLQARFGADRVIDSPLAESAIIGTAVGMAYRGVRPVVEIQFDGFVFPAFDQIVAQVARLHFRTQGRVRMPITIRLPYGGGIGSVEHHGESPESYFAHTPGLRVVTASDPQEAYSTLRAAIASDDPVLFLEPKARYWSKGEVDTALTRDLDSARVLTRGRDVTLATYGPVVQTALDAARAARTEGIEIEVIDLRSISPLDIDTVVASVERTGRLVVSHEAPGEVSVASELITSVVERAFASLESAPERVTGYDTPYPPSALEHHYLPSLDRILDAVDRVLGRRSSRELMREGAVLEGSTR
ncbi:alpha-ketoacid dehydrogenase subunit beta [Microbacterium stercoris]|uniref:Alpha-ketoacid dehydrogenase subunit beta n=1 Tax=Microbacterium stercoris TaxID=2820289 RepID=A0A939TVC4_9MICO|nr:alpha-ketoacid dehydrogenase subunit beta [Microbacterium stercoris]MBO3664949.1 alpha-ketoacid dehydrogenase subunit beta [Microbacterium stercoris]